MPEYKNGRFYFDHDQFPASDVQEALYRIDMDLPRLQGLPKVSSCFIANICQLKWVQRKDGNTNIWFTAGRD